MLNREAGKFVDVAGGYYSFPLLTIRTTRHNLPPVYYSLDVMPDTVRLTYLYQLTAEQNPHGLFYFENNRGTHILLDPRIGRSGGNRNIISIFAKLAISPSLVARLDVSDLELLDAISEAKTVATNEFPDQITNHSSRLHIWHIGFPNNKPNRDSAICLFASNSQTTGFYPHAWLNPPDDTFRHFVSRAFYEIVRKSLRGIPDEKSQAAKKLLQIKNDSGITFWNQFEQTLKGPHNNEDRNAAASVSALKSKIQQLIYRRSRSIDFNNGHLQTILQQPYIQFLEGIRIENLMDTARETRYLLIPDDLSFETHS